MRAAEDIFKVLSIPDYGGLQLHVRCVFLCPFLTT